MVRLSKPSRRRAVSYKRPAIAGPKGPSIITPRKKQINIIQGSDTKVIFIPTISQVQIMSRHTSFGRSNKNVKKRSVLKRFERVDVLKKLGRWKEGDNRMTGLPKTPIL